MSSPLSPAIVGTVQKGKFIADDPALFRQAFYCHENRRVTLSVKRYSKNRSSNQNAYYFGVVVAMIGDHIGESDQMTVHESLKAAHNYEMRTVDKKEMRITLPTSDLTTAEFEAYLERVRRWASEFFSLYIPLPNEIEEGREDAAEMVKRNFPGAKVT
jgi:hypothetical protein